MTDKQQQVGKANEKHPTDALPMPAKHRTTFPLGGGNEASIDYFTADQLRAERIAAYNLGRESMREAAAKKMEPLAGFNGAMKIRSIEL